MIRTHDYCTRKVVQGWWWKRKRWILSQTVDNTLSIWHCWSSTIYLDSLLNRKIRRPRGFRSLLIASSAFHPRRDRSLFLRKQRICEAFHFLGVRPFGPCSQRTGRTFCIVEHYIFFPTRWRAHKFQILIYTKLEKLHQSNLTKHCIQDFECAQKRVRTKLFSAKPIVQKQMPRLYRSHDDEEESNNVTWRWFHSFLEFTRSITKYEYPGAGKSATYESTSKISVAITCNALCCRVAWKRYQQIFHCNDKAHVGLLPKSG